MEIVQQSFHDYEIVRLCLATNGQEAELTVELLAPDNCDSRVALRFLDANDIDLVGFCHQNVIHYVAITEALGGFSVQIAPSHGCALTFRCGGFEAC
jgi:hypothetical protein